MEKIYVAYIVYPYEGGTVLIATNEVERAFEAIEKEKKEVSSKNTTFYIEVWYDGKVYDEYTDI